MELSILPKDATAMALARDRTRDPWTVLTRPFPLSRSQTPLTDGIKVMTHEFKKCIKIKKQIEPFRIYLESGISNGRA